MDGQRNDAKLQPNIGGALNKSSNRPCRPKMCNISRQRVTKLIDQNKILHLTQKLHERMPHDKQIMQATLKHNMPGRWGNTKWVRTKPCFALKIPHCTKKLVGFMSRECAIPNHNKTVDMVGRGGDVASVQNKTVKLFAQNVVQYSTTTSRVDDKPKEKFCIKAELRHPSK